MFTTEPKLCQCGCGATVKNLYLKGHHTKGKTKPSPSYEARMKMSLASKGKPKSLEHKDNMSKDRKGYVYPPVTDETRDKLSKISQMRWQDESYREKQLSHRRDPENRSRNSRSKKAAWARGDYDKSNFGLALGNKWAKPTIYKGIQMRSKIESRVAAIMDSYDVEWIYEPKRFVLNDLQTTYLPDFYLPEFNIWLDPKGIETNQEKIDSFRRMGHILVLVFHDEVCQIERMLSRG